MFRWLGDASTSLQNRVQPTVQFKLSPRFRLGGLPGREKGRWCSRSWVTSMRSLMNIMAACRLLALREIK